MKILYLTSVAFDVFGGNNHLNESLIENLLLNNHEVTLIQSSYVNPDFAPEKIKNNKLFKFHSIVRKKIDKKRMFLRGFDEIIFYNKVISEIKKINKKNIIDIIYYQSSGLSFYVIPKLKKITKKKIVLNIQDLFPDSLQATGSRILKYMILFLRPIQIKIFKKIDHFVVISEDIKNKLVKYGLNHNNISVIYNWYNQKEIYPVKLENNLFVNKYQLTKDKFIIQYAGNLGFVIDYDVIINIAKKISNDSRFIIQIVGDGSNKEHLMNLINKNQLTNIEVLPIQNQSLVKDVYSYADICLISLKKNVIYHSVPSKAGLALACNTPILLVCDKDSLFAQKITNIKAGFVFSNQDILGIVEALKSCIDNSHPYQEMLVNSTLNAKKFFSSETNINMIIDIIANVYKQP